ncbi:MAG TPA: AHH domain-containing protein [Gemmatimonadaceae bacterium]|nr:AHH domain-containing protein [Gemmatimonadaceae bacterium]
MSDKHFAKLSKQQAHIDGKGCVSKHEDGLTKSVCSYRTNGVSDAKSATSVAGRVKRKLYEWDFRDANNKPRLPNVYSEHKIGQKRSNASLLARQDPRVNEKAWWFDQGQNFANAFTPYNHNHHHIMPWTCLNGRLVYDEIRLLQEAEYNLNDGENMILLPCNPHFGIALQLPAHPYGHPTYNADVKTVLNQMKEAVKVTKTNHDITVKNNKDFKKVLVDWQKEQYDLIVDYGELLATRFLANKTVPSNPIDGCPLAQR